MPAEIVVEVHLFAGMREACDQRARVSLRMPPETTPEACFTRLCDDYPAVRAQRDALAVAVNDEYADWTRPLADGDAVSFIPPVSGG